MITNTEMAKVLTYLNRANLNSAKENQTSVWMDAISTAIPDLRMKVAEDAARWLALNRTADAGNTWITPGDFVLAVDAVRSEYLHRANIGHMSMIGAPSAYDTCPAYVNDADEEEWRRRVHDLIRDGYPALESTAYVTQQLIERPVYTPAELEAQRDRSEKWQALCEELGVTKALERMKELDQIGARA